MPESKYCFQHDRIYGDAKPKKEKTGIAKNSDSRKEQLKEYKKLSEAWLALPENQECQIKIDDGCLKRATVVNHTRGRENELLLATEFYQSSCVYCNVKAEEKHREARNALAKLSRHSPEAQLRHIGYTPE